MGLALVGSGVGVFILMKRKNNIKVQSAGNVGEVVSDKIPQENIVSQKIVNEAIVTETVGNNTIVEREHSRPVVITTPVKLNATTTPRTTTTTTTTTQPKLSPFMSQETSDRIRSRMFERLRHTIL